MKSTNVFILGAERSGSTWLSNIFNSHPDVVFFMEPFADYASIFPGFPSRNLYVSKGNKELLSLVTTRYSDLHRLKYSFLGQNRNTILFKYLERLILRNYEVFSKLTGLGLPLRIVQRRLINLNELEFPVKEQSIKNRSRTHCVVKDLRLNFKINLLSDAFPGAYYLVSIRHPGAQITSIKNAIDRGGLGELGRSLMTFFIHVRGCERFSKYWALIDRYFDEYDIDTKLILWWLINYEIVIEDLKLTEQNFSLVYLEELSNNPHDYVSRLFGDCALGCDKQVTSYIESSSTSKQDAFSLVNTNRLSGVFSKQSVKKVDIKLNRKISEIFTQHGVIHEIESHYGTGLLQTSL